MRSFLGQKSITSISRLAYVGGNSLWADTNQTARCYFRPLSPEEASLNNYTWGKSFDILVDNSVDIQEGDRVVVNEQTYYVKGVATHDRGREPYKKAMCVLPEKG